MRDGVVYPLQWCTCSLRLKASWERQARTTTATNLAVVLHEGEAKPIIQIWSEKIKEAQRRLEEMKKCRRFAGDALADAPWDTSSDEN